MKFETNRTFPQATGRTPQQTKELDIMNTNATHISSPATRRDKTRLNKLTAALAAAAFAILSLATLFHAENAHANGVKCDAKREQETKTVYYKGGDSETGEPTYTKSCDPHNAGTHTNHADCECECSSSSDSPSSDSGYGVPPSNWAGYWVDSGYYKPISYSSSTRISGSNDESSGCGDCSGCTACENKGTDCTADKDETESMCGNACNGSLSNPEGCTTCFTKKTITDKNDAHHVWCCNGTGEKNKYCDSGCEGKCEKKGCDVGDTFSTSSYDEGGNGGGGGGEESPKPKILRKQLKQALYYIIEKGIRVSEWCARHPELCTKAFIKLCELCGINLGNIDASRFPEESRRQERHYALHEPAVAYHV